MSHRLFRRDLFAALASLCMFTLPAATAIGGDGASAAWTNATNDHWDERTGEDLRNYPPSPKVDYEHMRLEIDIPDMNERRFEAVETLTFTPVGKPTRSLELDAKQLRIESVEALTGGSDVSWSHDGMVLEVAFEPALRVGETVDLKIEYAVEDPADGLFWYPEYEPKPGRPGRPAEIHTQGEPETNSYWFVCHDFPNDRLTTELIVTVPEGYQVSSNGDLAMKRTRGGRTTFHWRQKQNHVIYLVSLIVGKFDVVDVGTDELSMPVYVPPGKGDQVEQTFGRTSEMMRVFEDRFDEPYPWARYAQLTVWNFGAGGMENTAATTLYRTAVLDEKSLQDGDMDGLISHELGHQWFGDLLTCDSWAHIWLNEGFATYSESLWFERRDGYDAGYLHDVWRNMRRISSWDRLEPGGSDAHEPMVSRVYDDPNDVFRRRSNPYPKGASILHMLRRKLGEDLFFEAIQTYVDRYKFDTVETPDLRHTLEDVSGRNLERFFQQWVHRPGTPQVTVKADWRQGEKQLHLIVEQTQRVDAEHPAFAFTLPVQIINEKSSDRWLKIDVSQRRHERTVNLDAEPRMVVVDPKLDAMMNPTLEMPAGWLTEQLRDGPTVPSRLDAANALENHLGSAARDALVAAVEETGEHHAVREQAADALGELDEQAALIDLAEAGIADARVREAVIDALSETAADQAVETLVRHASDENESYEVRASALRGLGEHGGRDHLSILLAALESESQHDDVRRAALRALADLDEPEGLDAAIRYTKRGWLPRTRPVAIGAVADLAHHDKEKAYEAVAPLLDDIEFRARRAAGRALIEIEDERGVEDLRRLARSAKNPDLRDMAGDWVDRLAAALHEDEPMNKLRERVEQLSRRVEELEENLEEKK